MVAATPQVRLVLVRPRNPLNLLAAARATANFGFKDLVVVAPYEPVWEEARTAPGAAKWLQHARRVAAITEAIEDRNWILGTSCLSRRRVDPARLISLEQLRQRAARSRRRDRLALLFGSEKRGLSNRDLSHCHAVLRIPTDPACPSMNLAQAVAVCCYELRRWGRPTPPEARPRASLASAGELERVAEAINGLLPARSDASGSLSGKDRTRQERLRQMLLRLPLSSQDVATLLGILRDLSWRLQHRG
ncbi:MAG TPA: TrmH family RNA methyltransferase [Terriglobia bacterium]|nr:TrmH family RNA methyltransferase [Terriglobia bacterium]